MRICVGWVKGRCHFKGSCEHQIPHVRNNICDKIVELRELHPSLTCEEVDIEDKEEPDGEGRQDTGMPS